MAIQKLQPSYKFNEEKLKQLRDIAPEAFKDSILDYNTLYESLADKIGNDEFETEHYGLTWPGKFDARRIVSIPSKGSLIPELGIGIDEGQTKNIFIEGDNLEVLKILQKSYPDKINIIYIDPPYNTGKDFIYDDDFSEPIEEYFRRTGQIDEQGKRLTTNTKADGRFHSKWLSMMYPRLKLARNLLAQSGVIFISIDDNEVDNLKLIMNEIFGEECFLGTIIRATGTVTGQDANKLGSSFDYCLCYAKSPSFSLSGLPLAEKDLKRFNNDDNDGKGKYALLQLRKTGNADRKEDRENMHYPIEAPDGQAIIPVGPTGYLSRWRVAKSTFKTLLDDNLIVWKEFDDANEEDEVDEIELFEGDDLNESKSTNMKVKSNEQVVVDIPKWKPYVKYYLEGRLKKPSNLWVDIDGNKKGSIELRELFAINKIFDNPKPTQFIERLIQIAFSNDEKNIVLDFFAGSGTTGQAIYQYQSNVEGNINFILVQYPEKIKENTIAYKSKYNTISQLCKERIRLASEKVKSKGSQKDLGFKAFKLSYSNFKKWKNYNGSDVIDLETLFSQHENSLVDDWKPENLLTEILLIEGFPLDCKIEAVEAFKKNKVQKVTSDFCEHALFICLDKKVEEETIKALSLGDNDIFICLDNAITDQDKARLDDKGLIKTI